MTFLTELYRSGCALALFFALQFFAGIIAACIRSSQVSELERNGILYREEN